MKKNKNILVPLIVALMMVGLTLYFVACSEQSPLKPADENLNISLTKQSHIYASCNFGYINSKLGYEGGDIILSDGTIFHIQEGAITPPEKTPKGEGISLTLLVKKLNSGRQIRFTFGPSGSKFNPPAEVRFKWFELRSSNPKLYFIDKLGNYIAQPSEDVEILGKEIKLYIHHFSDYELIDE